MIRSIGAEDVSQSVRWEVCCSGPEKAKLAHCDFPITASGPSATVLPPLRFGERARDLSRSENASAKWTNWNRHQAFLSYERLAPESDRQREGDQKNRN